MASIAKKQHGVTLVIALGTMVVLSLLALSILKTNETGWNVSNILRKDARFHDVPSEIGDSSLTYRNTEKQDELLAWGTVRKILSKGADEGPGAVYPLESKVGEDGTTYQREAIYRGTVGVTQGCFNLDLVEFECHLIEVVANNGEEETRLGFTVPSRRTNQF